MLNIKLIDCHFPATRYLLLAFETIRMHQSMTVPPYEIRQLFGIWVALKRKKS